MWERRLPKEYQKHDLPAGASFVVSNENTKVLRLLLKAADEVYDKALKRDVIVPNSAVRVTFKGGTFTTHNSKMRDLLLNHHAFGLSGKEGFNIDITDPTGYWRASGVLTTGTQETVVAVASGADLKKLDNDAAVKRFKEIADKKEEIKPLAIAL